MTSTTHTPRRVQRTRTAGQPGMPPGAKYVGRGSKWGNPFRAYDNTPHERGLAAMQFALLLATRGVHPSPALVTPYPSDDEIRDELAGLDLACWCPTDGPCHADVLLAVAAGEDPLTVVRAPAPASSGSGLGAREDGGAW